MEGNAEFTYLNDKDLPAHGLGITNLCARPSSSGADLRKEEMQDGARILYEKVKRYRPQVGLFISGKGIWEEMYKMLTGKNCPRPLFLDGSQRNLGMQTCLLVLARVAVLQATLMKKSKIFGTFLPKK